MSESEARNLRVRGGWRGGERKAQDLARGRGAASRSARALRCFAAELGLWGTPAEAGSAAGLFGPSKGQRVHPACVRLASPFPSSPPLQDMSRVAGMRLNSSGWSLPGGSGTSFSSAEQAGPRATHNRFPVGLARFERERGGCCLAVGFIRWGQPGEVLRESGRAATWFDGRGVSVPTLFD